MKNDDAGWSSRWMPSIIFSRPFGLYVTFRWAGPDREALGFVVKTKRQMLFAEREGGYRRAFMIGPLYFRTYTRRTIR